MGEERSEVEEPPPTGERAGELYDTRVLLPIAVGCAAIVAGGLLSQVDHVRYGVLLVLLDTAVALLVAGAILYFVIGLWLIPGSLVLAGATFLGTFEFGSHLPQIGTLAGAAELVVGAIGAVLGLVRWRLPGRFSSGSRAGSG